MRYIQVHNHPNRAQRRASRPRHKWRPSEEMIQAAENGELPDEGVVLSLDPMTRLRQWAFGIGRTFIAAPPEAFEPRAVRRKAQKQRRRLRKLAERNEKGEGTERE